MKQPTEGPPSPQPSDVSGIQPQARTCSPACVAPGRRIRRCTSGNGCEAEHGCHQHAAHRHHDADEPTELALRLSPDAAELGSVLGAIGISLSCVRGLIGGSLSRVLRTVGVPLSCVLGAHCVEPCGELVLGSETGQLRTQELPGDHIVSGNRRQARHQVLSQLLVGLLTQPTIEPNTILFRRETPSAVVEAPAQRRCTAPTSKAVFWHCEHRCHRVREYKRQWCRSCAGLHPASRQWSWPANCFSQAYASRCRTPSKTSSAYGPQPSPPDPAPPTSASSRALTARCPQPCGQPRYQGFTS